MVEAVIVSAARSPIGRAFKGAMRDLRADDLTATIVQAALDKVPALPVETIDDLVLGCGLPGGEQGSNLARTVAVLMGHDALPGTTITRYCASSLQAARMAFHAIKAGEGDAYVAAGVEMVSRFSKGSSDEIPGQDLRNPLFDPAAQRSAARSAAEPAPWSDPRERGELPDAFISMGATAENVQQLYGISRADQDAYALLSQQRTAAARERGFWAREITPVALPDGTRISDDESPRPETTTEGLAELQPVFQAGGTVTAGNACPLNDGAAALIITSDARASELEVSPRARIVSTAVTALSPEIMGLGPVEAIRLAVARASLTLEDIDLFEINEAFAVQVLGCVRELDLDIDRLNVNGGAIAVGHPFGMTGARVIGTLLNSLEERDARFGVASMCVAGGMGMAMVIERL